MKKTRNLKGNHLVNAITANINQVVEQIQRTPVLTKLIEKKKLKIVGGYYHLETGKVDFLKTHLTAASSAIHSALD